MSFNINDKMDITVKVMKKEDKRKKIKDKKDKSGRDLTNQAKSENPDELESWKK